MCVRVRVCARACVVNTTDVSVRVGVYECVNMCAYASVCVCLRVYAFEQLTDASVRVCAHACVYVYVYVCVNARMCAYVYTCMCTRGYVYGHLTDASVSMSVYVGL